MSLKYSLESLTLIDFKISVWACSEINSDTDITASYNVNLLTKVAMISNCAKIILKV